MSEARETEIAAAALAAIEPSPLDGRRQWVHLLTPGVIQARDGRAFVMDDPKAVVAASLQWAGGTELAVDYEHQLDHAKVNGKPAPAAGWVTTLEARDTGVWGLVEWTEAAAGMIRRKEYRYVSPVIALTADHHITKILRVALTNNPALDELVALASAQIGGLPLVAGKATDGRSIPRRLDARALPRTAAHFLQTAFKNEGDGKSNPDRSPARLAAAETGRKPTRERSASMSISPAILAALDLPDNADETDVLAAIEALYKRAEDAAVAPASLSAMTAVMTQLNADRTTFQQERVAAKIESAMRDGVLVPGMRDWATELCSTNEAAFDGFVQQVGRPFAHLFGPSPITPEMEAKLTAETGGRRTSSPTADRIARQLGIDPKELG